MAELRLEGLRKQFGKTLAVEIPALTIRAGEFFTFVGPSGCGKSTTLNLIAGLEEPTTGTLTLGSRRLNELPPHQRDVAFVFQSYALYPHKSVRENLAFPLELAGTSRDERERRVGAAAELLELTPLLDNFPRQLSGGEKQRVALGRAIVRQPRLFLFDEPLSNLDAPLRAQMRKELKRLHQQLGTTFIYVTHDQEEALSLSDRIAVMKAGRVQQCGTPAEIYDQPANTFVASFFGTPAINYLEAAIATGTGATWLRIGEQRLHGPSLEHEVIEYGKVTTGIRPEHVVVSRERRENTWPAQVVLVELHGGQTYLELEAPGFRLTSVAAAEVGFRVGEAVFVGFEASRLHLFHPQTAARLPGGGKTIAFSPNSR